MNGSALRLAMKFHAVWSAAAPSRPERWRRARRAAVRRPSPPAWEATAHAAVRPEHEIGQGAIGVAGPPRGASLGQRQDDVGRSTTSVRHVGSPARSKQRQVPSPNWTWPSFAPMHRQVLALRARSHGHSCGVVAIIRPRQSYSQWAATRRRRRLGAQERRQRESVALGWDVDADASQIVGITSTFSVNGRRRCRARRASAGRGRSRATW